MSIDRKIGEMKIVETPLLREEDGLVSRFRTTTIVIKGVYGIVSFWGEKYLVVITKAEEIGKIQEHSIYQVHKMDYVRVTKNEHHLLADTEFKLLFREFGAAKDFYYSDGYSLHQKYGQESPLNEEFMANFQMYPKSAEQAEFFKKCIFGVVTTSVYTHKNKIANAVMISRRSVLRIGTRYESRGADNDGNTSNFVEIEDILHIGSKVYSFVQIRGSLPYLWTQKITASKSRVSLFGYGYPDLVICSDMEAQKAASKKVHEKYTEKYGHVVYLNLINNEMTKEKRLTQMFESIAEANNMSYVYWNYSKEATDRKKAREQLMEKVGDILREQSLTCFSKGIKIMRQSKVIRTNCFDSIDRTGAVQTLIGLIMHTTCLKKEGFSKVSIYEKTIEKNLKHHANTLSMQYSGTTAEKKLPGESSIRKHAEGLWNFYISCKRKYKCQFKNGIRNDAYQVMFSTMRAQIYERQEKISLFKACSIIIFSIFWAVMMYIRDMCLSWNVFFVITASYILVVVLRLYPGRHSMIVQ